VECAPAGPGVGATTLPADVEPSWAEAARFGVALFREAFARHATVDVRVQQVSGQIADTTVTAVAYATFHAVAEALRVEARDRFVLDDGTGSLTVKLPV
jgi:hypothetical protein